MWNRRWHLRLRRAALLIVDVQNGLFRRATPIYRADELLTNINVLVDRAHRAGAPVFYVQHSGGTFLAEGSDGWRLHPRLVPQAGDTIVHKRRVNAFDGTGLARQMASRDVKTVVITGLVTHACVRATCRGAKDLGYRVILVRDGHSNSSKHAAEVIERWNQRLAAGTVELCAALETTF